MFDHLYLAQEPPVEERKGEVGTPCKTSFVSALQQTVTVIFSSCQPPSARGQPRTHTVGIRFKQQCNTS